jgi:hypothetical protein
MQLGLLVIEEPDSKADKQPGKGKPKDTPGVTAKKQRNLSPQLVLNCTDGFLSVHIVQKGLDMQESRN